MTTRSLFPTGELSASSTARIAGIQAVLKPHNYVQLNEIYTDLQLSMEALHDAAVERYYQGKNFPDDYTESEEGNAGSGEPVFYPETLEPDLARLIDIVSEEIQRRYVESLEGFDRYAESLK